MLFVFCKLKVGHTDVPNLQMFLRWEMLNCHVERSHVYCPSRTGVRVGVRMLHIGSNVWSQEKK